MCTGALGSEVSALAHRAVPATIGYHVTLVTWLHYVPTADLVADGMTKPLQRVAFERFKNQLGVVYGPDLS
jgi:hypothetical protein